MTASPIINDRPALGRVVFLCRCPRCGKGGLYDGLLKVRDACPVCGLDLRGHDSGDGPVFFVLSFLCLVAVVGALALEFTLQPPLWAQALGWSVALPVSALLLLRPTKAFMIASQARLLGTAIEDRAGEGDSPAAPMPQSPSAAVAASPTQPHTPLSQPRH